MFKIFHIEMLDDYDHDPDDIMPNEGILQNFPPRKIHEYESYYYVIHNLHMSFF